MCERLGTAKVVLDNLMLLRKKLIGKAIIIASELQKLRGDLIRPIISPELEVIGNFQARFVIALPFHHPSNGVSVIEKTLPEDNIKWVGHRGMGDYKSHPLVGSIAPVV